MEPTGYTWQDWAWSAGLILGAIAGGIVANWLGCRFFTRLSKTTPTPLDDLVVKHGQRPMRWMLVVLALQLVAPYLPVPELAPPITRHILSLLQIGLSAWLVMSLLKVPEEMAAIRFDVKVSDNLAARRVQTQVKVLTRTGAVLVGIVAAAVMLMTFPTIRELGASLLASAGLAGIVVGFAARPVLQNLIAGVQLALTQPIRYDDVVVINGEFGRIEEIGSTFVVVKIWDERRLIVPLNFFIENTFENWTRATAQVLGTVFLFVDYSVPVEEVRAELKRVVEGSEKWDGRVCGLQVTDTTEHTVKLRALVSAADSSRAWDLRCLVRERLIAFVQERYPGGLPRLRVEQSGQGKGPLTAAAAVGAVPRPERSS